MILSAQSIRARCIGCENLLITPFVERSVSPNGRSFGLSAASYDVRIDQDVIVPPHGFVLASTVERFHMPDDLAGTVRDKSSWARIGLAVQNTLLDPGWCGYLTIELSNHSGAEIVIARDEPIAQIVFELLDRPTEQPYNGKYQNQERGPQPARRESVQQWRQTMKLRWRHESKSGLWESATSRHRYEIRESERSGSVGYDVSRFVAGSASGYARYIGGYHPYPTLEAAMAVVQNDANAVTAGKRWR
jgi:dCTP deaminase